MIQRYFREELPPIGNGETKHSRPPCLWKSRTMVTTPQRRTWTLQIYWWSTVFIRILYSILYRSREIYSTSFIFIPFLYCKNRRHNCSISVRLVSNTDHNEWLRFVRILIPAVLLQIFKYSFFSTLWTENWGQQSVLPGQDHFEGQGCSSSAVSFNQRVSGFTSHKSGFLFQILPKHFHTTSV